MWRFFAIAMLSVLMAGFAQAGAVTSTDLDAPDASASERDVEYAPGEDREPAPAPAAEPAKEAPVKTKKDEAPPQAPAAKQEPKREAAPKAAPERKHKAVAAFWFILPEVRKAQ